MKVTWEMPTYDFDKFVVKCQYTATNQDEDSESYGEPLYPDSLKEFVLKPDVTEFDITEHYEECGQSLKGRHVNVVARV